MSQQTVVRQTRSGPRRSARATPPLPRWRTIDLVTAALTAVTMGVVFWGWDLAYAGPEAAVMAVAAPLGSLVYGPWLLAGVLGALIIRRPGAAIFVEIVAATVSALLGTQWGWLVLVSGLLQGLGVELAVALLAYRRFGVFVAALGGALAALFEGVYEVVYYYLSYDLQYQVVYVLCFMLSGAVVAGLGGWALTRALARAGALNALPPGQEAQHDSAV
jgi:energy-coupling factor transport system permease protein